MEYEKRSGGPGYPDGHHHPGSALMAAQDYQADRGHRSTHAIARKGRCRREAADILRNKEAKIRPDTALMS